MRHNKSDLLRAQSVLKKYVLATLRHGANRIREHGRAIHLRHPSSPGLQSAGLRWAVLANFTRLAIAVGGGWLTLQLAGDLRFLVVTLSLRLLAFGLINAMALPNGRPYRTNAPA